ncbi:MAG TPA: PPOX class F420-dependent oxidoreductase [Ktedonosporobacter sp.]|nr:PPOX class F420-dependent oxidoreductase [Ktedonosporobacter sp.]
MSIIPENFLDILQSKAIAYVATIGPKGEPQVSPILFGWDGSSLFFSTNKIRQKHRNAVREPRIAVAITDPTNRFRSIEIRGVARVEEDVDFHFANILSQKYINQDATSNKQPEEERVTIFIEPERVFVFPFEEGKK